MKALQLYKFITENNIEWHWKNEDGLDDVLMFVDIGVIKYFNEIIGPIIFNDEGIICHMKDGYFAFWMYEICEYHNIELKEVFTPTSN